MLNFLVYFLLHISAKIISRRNIAENIFRSGSRSGSGTGLKVGPIKNRPDPQHAFQV
jgi:hypothetical protein